MTLRTAILISVKRRLYIVISATTYALALFFVIVICLTGYTAIVLQIRGSEYRLSADRRLMEKKSTEFLDRNKVDDTCDICFGEFENGRVYECKCGMRFHDECAEMTGECPYCKRKIDSMEVREIRRARCPCCHEIVEKNVCSRCNTVLPNKDMRFECMCGSTVYAGDGYCKDCGATFEFTYDPPRQV